MTKYMKSRHIPLEPDKPDAVKEELIDFYEEIKEAGVLLKTLREKNKMSTSDLAYQLGLSEEQILLFETKEQPIPVNTAKALGERFDIDYHRFL